MLDAITEELERRRHLDFGEPVISDWHIIREAVFPDKTRQERIRQLIKHMRPIEEISREFLERSLNSSSWDREDEE